jgi:predicted outer membrane repeat protein
VQKLPLVFGRRPARHLWIDPYSHCRSHLLIENSTFFKNVAILEGGVVFLEEHGSVDFRNVTMHYNTANYGGAIGVDPFSNVTVTDSTFESNSAFYSGGAIYGFLGSLTIERCRFDKHYAVYGGVAFLKVCNSFSWCYP